MAYTSRVEETSRELRVQRSRAQAKEKELAGRIVKLMEEGARKEPVEPSIAPQDNVPEVEMSNAHTTRPVRSSAQKAREQMAWLGYDSDDSEVLPIKAEAVAVAKGKTVDVAGQKR